MAYLARIETRDSLPIALPAPLVEPVAQPEFSPLEWSVVRLARLDRLWTIRPLSPLRRVYHLLIGRFGSPELANPRLEALRRIAVLSWHYGFTVPGSDVADFLSAGFTPDQYELMVHRIRAAATAPARSVQLKVVT